MALDRLVEMWRGAHEDTYARETITGTIAVTLRTMGKAASIDEAEAAARALWEARDREFLPYTT